MPESTVAQARSPGPPVMPDEAQSAAVLELLAAADPYCDPETLLPEISLELHLAVGQAAGRFYTAEDLS